MKRILCSVLCVVMLAGSLMFTANAQSYQPEVDENYISFDFNYISCGIIDNKPVAVATKNVKKEGVNAVMITPTPNRPNASGSIGVDCWKLASFEEKVLVPDYKYVGVTYYYETESPSYEGQLGFKILAGSTKATKTMEKTSKQTLVANQWTEAVFNFSDVMKLAAAGKQTPWLSQCHFMPFGKTDVTSISENDRFYIAKYTFYKTNPDPNATATVKFDKGTPEASGQMPSLTVKSGDIYTLPEPTFVYPDAEFTGWKVEGASSIIPAGVQITATDIDKTYVAAWKVKEVIPPAIAIEFKDYQGGTVNKEQNASVEIVVFDEKQVTLVTPNFDYEKDSTIRIDGWSYNKANINVEYFQYCTVEYFYESQNPVTDARMFFGICSGTSKVVNGLTGNHSVEPLVANEWAMAVIDYSEIMQKNINKATDKHVFNQAYLVPFGYDTTLHKLNPGDKIYIGRITFYSQKPDIEDHLAYMNGYTDGTFGVNGNMTRAEACTVVARLLEKEENIAGTSGFTDVAADQWYAKYIGFCAQKGLLASYKGKFYPNQAITRAEFAELVYLTGLAQATDKVVSFTDVSKKHAKYASISAAASAGLINGYDNGNGTYSFKPDATITRAEVVTIINRARGRDMTRENIASDILRVAVDVDATHWAFANIVEAVVPHVELGGNWVYALEDPLEALAQKADITPYYHTELGNAKVAELDNLEAQRIAAIRNTPNMDLGGIAGKIIYVSATDGNDENDGLTPETAVKTINKGNSLVARGDALVLKRGDTWRERFNAKGGVTYTAYGTGAKPVISGSPENGADPDKWALVYQNEETGALIWQYQNFDMVDIGTIVFNNEGYAYKEIPSSRGSKFVVRGGTKEFDYTVELDRNFEFFHAANSDISGGVISPKSTGPLYLRCDEGNPGKIFDSIEFNMRGNSISVSENDVTIDNICIMHTGSHGIGAAASLLKNLKVTNCEFGWIGGSIQSYNVSSSEGKVTRYGNGVEIYSSCDGYVVDNCYLWQCYDAGVTHQMATSNPGDFTMDNIVYSNNVITDTVYSIEYFLGNSNDGANYTRNGKNFLIEGNLLRRAGYGFGSTRPEGENQRHIQSWNERNEFENFVIRNNIFDRSVHEILHTSTHYKATTPKMEGNIYIQGIGNNFYQYGTGESRIADFAAEVATKVILGDTTGTFYFVDHIPYYEFSYKAPKTVEVTEDDIKEWAI